MKFSTLLAFSTTAYGLAFDGPLPTPVTDLVYAALTGFSPKPTNNVRALPDLFRRQKLANSAVCGYLNGDSDFPVSCTSSSSCIFSASAKWFGCCTGSNCDVMTRCINSASVSSCLDDVSCYNDPMAMACSASSAPFCVNMFAKVAEGTMSHWVCGASATSVAVLTSTSASASQGAKTTADATPIKQDGGKSGTASALNKPTASGQSAAAASPTDVKSTGGGAMQTAGAVAGVAGGLVGAFALFL